MSIKRQFSFFLLRWFLNTVGLYVAAIMISGVEYFGNLWLLVLAGFILSIMNAIIRPIVLILSLPAILLTLGLFMLVVNGFVVYLAGMLTPGITITFFGAILTGLIIGVLNYFVSSMIEFNKEEK